MMLVSVHQPECSDPSVTAGLVQNVLPLRIMCGGAASSTGKNKKNTKKKKKTVCLK